MDALDGDYYCYTNYVSLSPVVFVHHRMLIIIISENSEGSATT